MKKVIGIIVGFVLGLIIVGVGHVISSGMYPPPEDLNINDQEMLIEYIQGMPTKAIVFVIFSHAMAGFFSAFIAARLSDEYKLYVGYFVGVLFVISTVVNAFSLPHSFAVAGIDIFSTIFLAFLGARLGARSGENPK